MRLWMPRKRGQHGQDRRGLVLVLMVAAALLALAFGLRTAPSVPDRGGVPAEEPSE